MTTTEDMLCEAAKKASRMAYAPHSNFRVGAAVLTDRGVFSGCNVENASYGLTICAERSAVFSAVAGGARKVRKVAVYSGRKPAHPCGACLQVIREFASPEAVIILCSGGKKKKMRLGALLPQPFEMRRA